LTYLTTYKVLFSINNVESFNCNVHLAKYKYKPGVKLLVRKATSLWSRMCVCLEMPVPPQKW